MHMPRHPRSTNCTFLSSVGFRLVFIATNRKVVVGAEGVCSSASDVMCLIAAATGGGGAEEVLYDRHGRDWREADGEVNGCEEGGKGKGSRR